ncbi:alpha/beta fold hydrolase [Kribbella flavida]|nr:alpha/beta hydrolase [Kribbella flavida]
MIAIDNRQVHYEDAGGDGTPVLALHGVFGRGRTFAQVARRLAPAYRVIAPDLRGHGLTTGPADDFGRDAFVADAAAFVERLLPAPALVMGHSLGGVTAYQLAARRPELVRAVVVEDVGAVTDESALDRPVLDVTSWPRHFATRADAVDFFAATPAPDYFLESVVERTGRWQLLFDPDVMMAVQHGNAGDWWHDWLAAAQPILLLRAANSFLLSEPLAAEMVRRRPATQLVTVGPTGHWIHRKDPNSLAAAVRVFFDRVLTSQPPAE